MQEDAKARGEKETQAFRPPEGEVDNSTSDNLKRYLGWTDPVVWDLIDSGKAGAHGELIRQRKHDRVVARTTAVPTPKEVFLLQRDTLPKVQHLGGWLDMADSAWCKFDRSGIYVTDDNNKAVELPNRSAVVKGLEPVFQARVYVPLDGKEKANTILQ